MYKKTLEDKLIIMFDIRRFREFPRYHASFSHFHALSNDGLVPPPPLSGIGAFLWEILALSFEWTIKDFAERKS